MLMMYVCSMSETVQLEDGCATARIAQRSANNDTVHFGSNVSRLKSRFLQQVSDATEPTSCRHRPVLEHQSSLPPSNTLPAAAEPHLLDMADHVEKFRHTRALFAQLAEQTTTERPSPLPRPVQRSFRSTSSASPPPTRTSHIGQARRSMSPTNDRNSRSLGQTLRHTQGQTVSCNGITAWSQLGSRSLEENSRPLVGSGSSAVSSRSQLCSRLSEEGLRSQLSSGPSSESLRSEVTSRSSAKSSRSWQGGGVDPGEVAGVILRRNNRPNLDLSVGAGHAVLLPKRRSREETSLMVSKDCLEASLSQADEYWRRQQLEQFSVGDADPLMSESTFSSGSGEEMARSESGHDLAAALKDTTLSPTADSAEMWSRRLSAAMEAKCSVADGNRTSTVVECNGANHTFSWTAESNGVVTSSRSLWTRGNLENSAGGSASDDKTLLCCATGGSHHIAVQNEGSSAIVMTAVDLSRSSDSSRSSVYCDLEVAVCSSSPVSELVKGNAADYSQHVTPQNDNNNLQTVVSRSRDPSRSSSVQCDLDHTAGSSTAVSDTLKVGVTDSGSQHLTSEKDNSRTLPTVNNFSRSLPACCDLERGSSADCEMLEGSVADCECKDVDTEKPLLQPDCAYCCETVVLSTSVITSSHTADGAGLQQQAEGSIFTGTVLQPPEVQDKLPCSGLHSGALLQESGVGDQLSLEQRKGDTACCLDLSSSHSAETVVEELSASYRSHETADRMLQQEIRNVATDVDTDAHSPEAGTQPQNHNDVQAMSVSEDDESSGDTDYVVLGEPVSKQATRYSVEELKHAQRSNVP